MLGAASAGPLETFSKRLARAVEPHGESRRTHFKGSGGLGQRLPFQINAAQSVRVFVFECGEQARHAGAHGLISVVRRRRSILPGSKDFRGKARSLIALGRSRAVMVDQRSIQHPVKPSRDAFVFPKGAFSADCLQEAFLEEVLDLFGACQPFSQKCAKGSLVGQERSFNRLIEGLKRGA
jgi:hypothetical protein